MKEGIKEVIEEQRRSFANCFINPLHKRILKGVIREVEEKKWKRRRRGRKDHNKDLNDLIEIFRRLIL